MATALTATSSSFYGPQRWSDLPDELLHCILIRLCHIRDLLAFSSVCRYWRSFATSIISASPTTLFPPLLICPVLHYRSRRRRRLPVSALKLLDPASPHPSIFLDRSPVEESILSLRFLSSSHGHLLFLSRRRQIIILNFITGRQIISPVLPMDYEWPPDSRLAQLTAPVSSPSCTLIFLTADYLNQWKTNSPYWISHSLQVSLTFLRQMVIVGRRIWALELGNKLSVLELPQDLSSKVHFLVVQWPSWKWDRGLFFDNTRLVNCEGEILCVCFVDPEGPFVEDHISVKVCRFDMSNDQITVVRMNNLGNRAFFLSASVNAPGCVCKNPERWGGKNNCIYYVSSGERNWLELEVGGSARGSLFVKANRSTCSFPFWDFPCILQ